MLGRQAIVIFAAISCVCQAAGAASEATGSGYRTGSTSVLMKKYIDFQRRQQGSASQNTVAIPLGYVKGLSRSFSGSAGRVLLDLGAGTFSAELSGLTAGEAYALWLVDQPQGSPVSDLAGARSVKLGEVRSSGSTARLTGSLKAAAAGGLAVDRVVLSRDGASPADVVASGSMSVLQKLYFGRTAVAGAPAPGQALPFGSLVPAVTVAAGDAGAQAGTAAAEGNVTPQMTPLDVLISQGANLFFNETFSGNGRTCGTCHPANRNFTIDPEFIATLPGNHPLFVAEFNPALAQLERPALMRQFGLILENVDGLDNPTVKFVMRSVPHTLGMSVSLIPDTSQVPTPAAMTGWSGDGAPGSGSLRDFAVGAVTQHASKTLNRVAGVDFVLPNNQQLDAMEAFQLSLGRTADFDLTKITFLDAGVANGLTLFNNGTGDPLAGGRCSACHANGGALATNGLNRNFNTNVEDVVHPARSVQNFPIDGGFGLTANADGSFGNRAFNTTSVVEAADTEPFFHNNVVSTLEGVVNFYSGPEFNNPRLAGARFSFTPAQVSDIANFMRGINTLQNIDVARRELQEILALTGNPQLEVQSRLESARLDCNDAIRVLGQTGIFLSAVTQITSARQLVVQAQQTNNPSTRDTIINQAITALNAAQNLVAAITP